MELRDTILQGDVLEVLRTLPDGCVQTVVTSPPYFGLRDYGLPPTVWDGDTACEHKWGETILAGEGYSSGNRRKWQHKATRDEHAGGWQKQTAQGEFCQLCGAWRGCLGLEPTPQLYVSHMVAVFAEVRRVLRNDGTLWLNLGDSYAGSWGNYAPGGIKSQQRPQTEQGKRWERRAYGDTKRKPPTADARGLKPKDLCGIPWRVAFALQDDGWWLRSDIVWAKSNPMPESVTDRPTRSHEYIFLLAKSQRYYYDADAIREPVTGGSHPRTAGRNSRKYVDRDPAHLRPGVTPKSAKPGSGIKANASFHAAVNDLVPMRNKRSVWTVATAPFAEAHFATFPPKLITPCILAGASAGGLVLDPFMGSGSTGYTARLHSRHYLGIELNPEYIEMAERRIGEAKQPHLWTA